MPDWVRLLWRAAEARLYAGPIADDDAVCLCCKHAVRAGAERPAQAAAGDIFTCHKCLGLYHLECDRRLAVGGPGATSGLHEHPDGACLVCALCS